MADPVLRIANFSRAFGALKACDDVSLELHEGEIHALIGPNGAGKSTLMKLMAGELKADTGHIEFCGRSLDGLDAIARARAGLARTFQVSSLIPEFTVLQNAMLAVMGQSGHTFGFFGSARNDDALTGPALEHIGRFALESRANERVSDISHGERRQLEVALAVAFAPRAILMDEPMAGVGPGGTKDLTGILGELRAQIPILLVEHDMDAVFALADRISVLVGGRVIASGKPKEIRANEDVRQAYLGSSAP